MMKAIAALAVAAVFALSGCGNTGDDGMVDEPVPGQEEEMPGEDGVDEDLEDMDEDAEEEVEDETEG